jgi:hypothetical protein
VTGAVRTAEQREADTLARPEADADVWAATANAGRPHQVPLSLAQDGRHVIPAAPAASPTARNAAATGETRTGWNPRQEDVPHVYLIATPRTKRA